MVNSPADKLLSCATLITGSLGAQTFSATGFFQTIIKRLYSEFLYSGIYDHS